MRELEPDQHRRAKAIFVAARGRPPGVRAKFVEAACGDDRALRREVDSLLQFAASGSDSGGSTLRSVPMPIPEPEEIAGYRLVRRIGEGGMGEVWEAEQIGALRRTVALKLVKPGMDTRRMLARFETERRVVAQMNHPAIAQVYEAGATELGRPYFAMEYVRGEPITAYCDRRRLDLRRRLGLFLDVCAGVEHAHQRGAIHRDLKPSNILVAERDGTPVPKLIDFGVASAVDRPLGDRTFFTELGEWVGTPDYMSPEQAAGAPGEVDRRSDVYSLGVLLYELLVGVRPVDPQQLRTGGPDAMRRRIREEVPPRPSVRIERLAGKAEAIADRRALEPPDLRRRLRNDLDWIVMRALEKDPQRRYLAVAALAADLERYLRAEPVRARAPSARYRFATLYRRHRAVANVVVVALVVLVAAPPARSPRTVEVLELYAAGREALRSGLPEAIRESLAQFDEVVQLDPEFAPAQVGLAEGYLALARRGDLPMEVAEENAGRALARALELDSSLAEAHLVSGQLRSTMGDLEGAESAFRRALELDESLTSAYLRLGEVLAARNRPAEADAYFDRAVYLDPLNVWAHHALANHKMNRGLYDEGMLQFQRWLRIEPDSTETYRRMSLYARTYGRLDDALRWAAKAVELAPEAPLNLHELVMAYSALGEHDAAEAWMARAYDLAPSNHWTVTLRAFVWIDRGDLDAVEEFAVGQLEALGSPLPSPLPPAARVRLALGGQSKVYRGDFAAAAELYERAMGEPFVGVLELGIDADALSYLALAYSKLGRERDAARTIARCRELVGSRRDWIWSHLIMPETIAALYALEGRDDEAISTLRRAIADGWLSRSVLVRGPHFESLRRREDFQTLVDEVEARLGEMRRRVEESRPPEPQSIG